MVEWPDLAARVQVAGQRALGESVTYTPSGDAPVSIRGVFSEAGLHVELMAGVEVETRGPVLSVHLADLAAAPAHGDAVTVRSQDYTVLQVIVDGEGDADLFLEEV